MSKYLITTLAILFFFLPQMRGEERRDSVVVSLLTCWPGSEIYELCGHEAIRVRGYADGHQLDSVWNYGVFDFNTPNFAYRYVKGETDYMLGAYPFYYFLPEYQRGGRKVLEQDLNFTPQEAKRFLGMLREEARPENRVYRYNYVRDNCATRIVDRVDSVAGGRVAYPDHVRYGTFRRQMRHYHSAYPWYQFGIDIALGSGIDVPISGREEMFVPMDMAERVQGAHFPDGRQLVSDTRILNAGVENASLPPTPWYLTPLFICGLWFLLSLGACVVMARTNRIWRWLYCLWYGLVGLAGCLVAFLVFVSVHEATSPNVLLLWLNPLQLLMIPGVLSRRMKILALAMAWYDIISLGVLLIVWPFQMQSANPAFFPLMGSTLALAATYAIIAARNKVEKEEVVKARTSSAKQTRPKRKR